MPKTFPSQKTILFRVLEGAAIVALAIAASTCLFLALAPDADAAELPKRPKLKALIIVSGPSVSLGDAFNDAGDKGAFIIAPAPAEGTTSQVNAQYLIEAAISAGLLDPDAAGLVRVTISRQANRATGIDPIRRDARSDLLAASDRAERNGASQSQKQAGQSGGDRVIRKGDIVTMRFVAPGILLATQGRALNDAREGEALRVVNLQSNRTIDVYAAGPGLVTTTKPDQG